MFWFIKLSCYKVKQHLPLVVLATTPKGINRLNTKNKLIIYGSSENQKGFRFGACGRCVKMANHPAISLGTNPNNQELPKLFLSFMNSESHINYKRCSSSFL
jgi:hypothetical protein